MSVAGVQTGMKWQETKRGGRLYAVGRVWGLGSTHLAFGIPQTALPPQDAFFQIRDSKTKEKVRTLLTLSLTDDVICRLPCHEPWIKVCSVDQSVERGSKCVAPAKVCSAGKSV